MSRDIKPKMKPDSPGTWISNKGEPVVVERAICEGRFTAIVCGEEKPVMVEDLPFERVWYRWEV